MAYWNKITKPSTAIAKKKLAQMQPKKSGDHPLFLCEFFEGMDVLQIQGIATGEFLFGMYFSGKLCGHVYFGENFTAEQATEVSKTFLPPTWDDIQNYVDDHDGVIWYHKFAPSQYAWIYERILEKKST